MAVSVDAHKNLAISAVATAPSPATSGTSLVVTTGHGTRFPAAPFNATIWPTASQPTPANAEIVRVTAVSTDTLTITRAQEGTTARTVVVGDQIAATVTKKSLSDVEDSLSPPFSELTSFGHSLTTGYGGSSAEYSWPHRFAKVFNAELAVYGQNGALLSIDDMTSTTDGGIMTVAKYAKRKLTRTAAPYIAPWGVMSFHYGVNDTHNFGVGSTNGGATTVDKVYKGALRACVGWARSARWWADNSAGVTLGGTHGGALTGTEDQTPFGRLEYIATANVANYWELAVPSDYHGNSAVWVFMVAQAGNGAICDVKVDGGTTNIAAINGVAGATTIDNRQMAYAAGYNAVHAYKIDITASGSHTLRITPTTITGGVASLLGFSMEAEVPPIVLLPNQYKLSSYTFGSGFPAPPDDTQYNTLNTWTAAVAAECTDGKVVVVDADSAINKTARYIYSDGLHLNDDGAEVVAGAALDAYRKAHFFSGRDLTANAKKGSVYQARQNVKYPVKAAATANASITSAPASFDGYTPDYFDTILLPYQTTGTECGVYRWFGASRPMEREAYTDTSEELYGGVQVNVQNGTINKNSTWQLANTGAVVVGTTTLRWTRVNPPLNPQSQRTIWGPGVNAIETIEGTLASANLSLLSSGRLTLVGDLVLPAGQPFTSITFWSATTAANGPTHQLFGIFRQSDRALLATTADATSAAWAANSAKTLNLTATYTPDQDTPVYLGCMVTATTAVPTLLGSASPLVQINTVVPIRHGTSSTGLTTALPNPAAAITAVAGVPYAYVS